MSRYKSEQVAYSPLKKKNVPIWKIDTNSMTVTHFNTDTQTEASKTYHTDFIRYHLHFSDSHCPDGSSTRAGSCNTLMIWNGKSVKLSHARWSFGSRSTVAIRKLSSAVMLRRCLVLRTASSIWQEKRCLSVWFIFNRLRLCLQVLPLFVCIHSFYDHLNFIT